MLVCKCDSCHKTISNPYEEKMKEFYIGYEIDYGGVFPTFSKRKTKIDLCEDCFRGLRLIAAKKRGDTDCEKYNKKDDSDD